MTGWQRWHKYRYLNLDTGEFVEDVFQHAPGAPYVRWVRRRTKDGSDEIITGRFWIARLGRTALDSLRGWRVKPRRTRPRAGMWNNGR